jgi:hypothetical protein
VAAACQHETFDLLRPHVVPTAQNIKYCKNIKKQCATEIDDLIFVKTDPVQFVIQALMCLY